MAFYPPDAVQMNLKNPGEPFGFDDAELKIFFSFCPLRRLKFTMVLWTEEGKLQVGKGNAPLHSQ